MSKILTIAISSIILIVSFLSAFLWAAFDITWWEPVETNSGRWFVLVFLHITVPLWAYVGLQSARGKM